jgi:hypothetical protein
MLTVSKRALVWLAISQQHSLGSRDEMALITLPYVPHVPCRYRQRKWHDSGWRAWCPEQVYVQPAGRWSKPAHRPFAASVPLVYMRGGTAAIPEG